MLSLILSSKVIPVNVMGTNNSNFYRYDKGAHLFLPSYVMRTHGARQQREAVKKAPKEQMQTIFEVFFCLMFISSLQIR